MIKSRTYLPYYIHSAKSCKCGCFVKNAHNFTTTKHAKPFIKLEKCLVFAKLSKFEYERKTLPQLNDQQFEKLLRNRGTDYDMLKYHLELNKNFIQTVVKTLKQMGIQTQVATRLTCTKDMIDWADVIIPTGGDGTFLLAASKIKNSHKPVVGFNSDPIRSEGFLCLPKKYSSNIKEALEKLKNGQFQWLLRNRIRTTLIGSKIYAKPLDLHKMNGENLYEIINTGNVSSVVPVLALNEVFIGESLSARVSYLEMTINDADTKTKIKSSGLCVATGTGSTSWYYSMNRLPSQSVAELLRLLDMDTVNACEDGLAKHLADVYNKNLVFKSEFVCDEDLIEKITELHNDSFIFSPDDSRMGYTIRDLISAGVWPQPKGIQPRGFASKIRVRSRCCDAGLVIDGNVSFPFNDGTEAVLEIHPEDALRTVVIPD